MIAVNLGDRADRLEAVLGRSSAPRPADILRRSPRPAAPPSGLLLATLDRAMLDLQEAGRRVVEARPARPRRDDSRIERRRYAIRAVQAAELEALDDRHDREFDDPAARMHDELATIPRHDTARRVAVMQARQARAREIWDRQDRERAELKRRHREVRRSIR